MADWYAYRLQENAKQNFLPPHPTAYYAALLFLCLSMDILASASMLPGQCI